MADLEAEVVVTVNASQLRAALEGILTKLIGDDAKQLDRLTKRVFRDLGDTAESNARRAAKAMTGMAGATRTVEQSVKAVSRTIDALGGAFGKGFNPDNLEGFNDALLKLVQLQAKVASGTLSPDGLAQTSQEIKLVTSELVAFRESFLSAGRAADEASRNIARDTRQAARVAVQESRASTSRFVVDQQTQASAARDASRRRIAIIQAAARTIATIERGLSNIFRQTARVFSSAFTAAANTVTGVANGIGRAFTRTTTNIRNSVVNSNSEVSRSYRKSFGDTTNTVRNETKQQTSIISNFAREASSSIGSIGAAAKFGLGAAIGGLLGVGAAKALRGGFDRATTIETANRGLEVLLGNAEDAKQLLDEVVGVVTGTPFRLDQFAEGAARLVAFNVQADKIPGILAAAGDAAALSGANAGQVIDTLIRVTGQATASGKIYGDGILSLADAGIPALRILGNAFNKNTADIQEMLTNGVIPAEEALDALFKGIVEGSDGVNGTTRAFGGLAKSLGTTLSGSLSNFRIAFDRLGANLYKVFTPAIVAAAQAATAAVDLIGAALLSVATSIQSTPLFNVLLEGLESFGAAAVKAKTSLKPLFDFLADGVVIVGQVAGALFVFNRIPAVLSAVGSALKFILAPSRLLIGAAVLVSSYFKQLYDDSEDLRDALGKVGAGIRRIATVIKDLAVDAFGVLRGGVDEAGKTTTTFARRVLDVVVPALEKLASFLVDTVLPPIRRFAKFIRTDVLPVVGRFLATSLEKGSDALRTFAGVVGSVLGGLVDFVRVAYDIIVRGGTAEGLRTGGSGWLAYNGPVAQGLNNIRNLLKEVAEFFRATATILWKGDEYTEGTGWLSEDGLIIRGLNNIRSAMESVVNFTKSNLTPVLIGVGAALGAAALSGGNIPLAGLAGATAGIVAALSNDDIRNALIDTVKKGIEGAREALKNFVDSGTLTAIGVNVLKVARKIGEILGDILTDPRLLALVAGIAAYAVTLAGAFAVGFAEGVIGNIPELARAITKALQKAATDGVKAAARNPALAAAAVLLFGGALFLRGVAKAGKAAAAEFNRAASLGPGNQFRAQSTGATSFIRSLIGGPNAIAKNVQAQFKAAEKITIREGQRLQRIAVATTGRVIRNDGGQFLKQTDAAGIAKGYDEMAASVGKTNLAAGQLRAGIGQVGDAFRKNTPFFKNFKDGLRSIGEGAGTAFKQFGQLAGVAAGAAFMGAFAAQVAFQSGATSADVATGLGGALVAGLGASLAAGGPLTPTGAGVGAAVAGLSLLGGAFLASKADAEALRDSVNALADSLEDLNDIEFGETIEDTIRQRLRDADLAPRGAREVLIDLGYSTPDFADAAEAGEGLEYIANLFERIGGPLSKQFADGIRDGTISLGRLDDVIRGSTTNFVPTFDIDTWRDDIRAAGYDTEDLAGAADFLGESLKYVDLTFSELDLRGREGEVNSFGQAFLGASGNVQTLEGNILRYSAEMQIAAATSDAFKTKLAELNEARLDSARANLEEVTQRLDDARDAAGEAKAALIDYLSGDYAPEGLQAISDQATLDVGAAARAAAAASGEGLTEGELIALSNKRNAEFASAAGDVLAAAAIDLGRPLTEEEATTFLAPLEAAGAAAGGLAGLEAVTAIDGAFQRYFDETGIDLSLAFKQQETTATGLESSKGRAEQFLRDQLAIDPITLQPLVDEAAAFAEKIGTETAAGLVKSLDGDETAAASMKTWSQGIIDAALATFGISSPSLQFEIIGGFTALGFIKGIENNLDKIAEVGVKMKEALAKGLDPEGDGEYLAFFDAGRDAGYAFGDGTALGGVTASLTDRGVQLANTVLLGVSESGEHLLFLDSGTAAGLAFGKGMAQPTVISSLKDRGLQMVKTAVSGMSESGEWLLFLDAGRNAGRAFARGLSGSTAIVAAAGRSVARAASNAVRNELKMESPSRVMRDLGEQTMQGFADGIEASTLIVADAAGTAVQGAIDAVTRDVGGIEIGVTGNLQTSGPAPTPTEMTTAAQTSAALTAISQADIAVLARMIAKEAKPNVQIEQVFNEPVDSRAMAADVAWRLT